MELPIGDATAIWSKSIAGAEAIGPLAAWMVSGHFQRLLEHSEHARLEPLAARWLAEIRPRRDAWFAKWQAIEPELRDATVADEALDWLWAFDEASLWICCHGPTVGEERRDAGGAYVSGCGTAVEMQLGARRRADAPAGRWTATATPWLFDTAAFDLTAPAKVAPAMHYASSASLLAATSETTLRWRFVAEESGD